MFAAISILSEHGNAWQVLAGLLAGASLGLRRKHLGMSLAIAWANAACQLASHDAPLFWATFAILQVLYSVARHGEGKTRIAGWASLPVGTAVGTVGILFFGRWWFNDPTSLGGRITVAIVFTALSLGITWTIGLLVRMRTRYVQSQLSAEYAAQSVAMERERGILARDMHDVLAHSLSVMVSLSDGTRLGVKDLPEQAKRSLQEISEVGRSALTDVRGLLTRLRSEGTYEAAATTLETLYNQMRSVGLQLVVSERGEPYAITTPAYTTVCNVMRESLTNALRHGDNDAPVHINLDWHKSAVDLGVINATKPGQRQAYGDGHWGIKGMRERVTLVNGALSATQQDGQFVVTAMIPNTVHTHSTMATHAAGDSASAGSGTQRNPTEPEQHV